MFYLYELISSIFYPFTKFNLGTLYPAYKTWKSLKRKDDLTRRRWLKYWVSFAAFQVLEPVADIFLSFILPFYIWLKLGLILWLVIGSKLIFDSIVNRELAKWEKIVDKLLNRGTKLRNEAIAFVWFKISRCSMEIIAGLMSGGISVLVSKTPENSKHTTPMCSEIETDAGPSQDSDLEMHELEDPPILKEVRTPRKKRTRRQLKQIQQKNDNETESEEKPPELEPKQQSTLTNIAEPDYNENTVSMDWSANGRRGYL